MPKSSALSNQAEATSPNYSGLVKYLIEPLLEVPESLRIDCEYHNNNQRIWVRVAFEGGDKGRVFGRGGRNLQAIRTVLTTAAAIAGQSLYLDIFGGQTLGSHPHRESHDYESSRRTDERKRPSRPSANGRPSRSRPSF